MLAVKYDAGVLKLNIRENAGVLKLNERKCRSA